MSVRALVAVAVAAFVVFLSVRAPAALVANAVAGADPALTVHGVSGSAWRGRAQQVQYGAVSLGALDWTLSPAALLTGRAVVEFHLAGPNARLDGAASRSLFTARTTLREVTGVVPLSTLAAITGAQGPLDALLELDRVSLSARGERIDDADGSVQLRNTVALAPRRYPLGTYRLALSAVDGRLRAEVVESNGPLALAGHVAVDGAGAWELDARVRAEAADSELAMVLQLLGDADAEGYRALRLQGAL